MFISSCLFSSESGQPICGNGMVEQGEECDCGYSDQCKDECCYDANQPEGKKCKLKPGKQCRYLLIPVMLMFLLCRVKAVMINLKQIKRCVWFWNFVFICYFALFALFLSRRYFYFFSIALVSALLLAGWTTCNLSGGCWKRTCKRCSIKYILFSS